ncbi:MAG: sigma-70 family RNA polymerase sigma factor [Candidatus Riflebacteria bacterium]|nr:sigma-70 family RNA polymerase sigma factor [Candidatus Riflebacteria bacterium]
MDDELRLIERVLAGDRDAFEALVRTYQHKVFTLLVRMLRDRETAQDLTQEVFLKVYQRLGDLKERARLGGWILQVAHNLALDHIKRRRVDAFSADFADETTEHRVHSSQAAAIESPEEIVLRMTPGTLSGLMEALDAKYREVLTLRFVQGFSFQEIAKIMGLPLTTVKFRKHYAMQILKEKWLATEEASG